MSYIDNRAINKRKHREVMSFVERGFPNLPTLPFCYSLGLGERLGIMARRKTNEEYHDEVKRINPHIDITGTYLNNNTKMNCKCKRCGYEWTSTARNLLKHKKCLGCIQQARIFEYPDISHEKFCETIKGSYPSLVITGKYYKGLQLISCTCQDCNQHSRVRVQMLLEGTYKCPICETGKENIKYGINDIKTVNPVLYECLYDKSDADKYTINSRSKVDFICLSCGNLIKNKSIDKTNRYGLKCKCQDGNSLGEKYFYQVIKSVDENVEAEKYLNGNYSYRYDFYGKTNNKTWICEIQGKQHSVKSFETCGGRSLDEEIQNDEAKKEFALSQGIDYYIQIDSKESGFNQLKQSILNSDLTKLYSFESVDWVDCYKKSLISDIIDVAELWNKGYKVMEICSKTGFGKGTVRKHLMKANEIGVCNYDHTSRNEIKVACVDTGEIFNSLREAEIKYNIRRGYISAYLKGRTTLPVANKVWKYYEASTAI